MSSEKFSPAFDNLLFSKIFQTFRIAIQPSKLIIAFLAVVVICLAGWIMDFSNSVVATDSQNTELEIFMADATRLPLFIEIYEESGSRTGVFSTLWGFASEKFNGALESLFAFNLPAVAKNIAEYFKALEWALRYHWLYCIIFFVIKLAVISVAGGGLCRIAALQFARGEKPGLTEAIRFGITKFTSFFTAPLIPVGVIIFIGLGMFLLGLIGNIPRVGELMVGFFTPLALMAGALIAVVSIGLIAGFNLIFPAVACDGSDSFDAISRSFRYVYSRPWRMGLYTVAAAVYGAICYTSIRFFTFLLLLGSRQFIRLGLWVDNSNEVNKLSVIWPRPSFTSLLGSSDLAASNWAESVAAFLIHLFLLAVLGLLISFIISFYFSANTVIYALLRNKVDDIALDDVHTNFTEPVAQEDNQTQTNASPTPE